MRKIRNNIPNALTLLNLLCGAIAATRLIDGDLAGAQVLIALSLLFDLMDGAAARILNAKSALGKDLDSLADVVSFGFTPSLMLFMLMGNSPVAFLAFLPLIAAAVRLAIFNQSTDQGRSFRGLPVPAAAIIIMTLPLIEKSSWVYFSALLHQPVFLLFIALLVSALMVSKIRLFSMKINRFDWGSNSFRYLMLILTGLALLLAWPFISLFFVFFYVSISLIFRRKIEAEESKP